MYIHSHITRQTRPRPNSIMTDQAIAPVAYSCDFISPKVGRCGALALNEGSRCGERCEAHRFRESTARMCETKGCPRTLLLGTASMNCSACDPSGRARRCIQNRRAREEITAQQLETLIVTSRLREKALTEEIRQLTDRLAAFVCAGAFAPDALRQHPILSL
jgi:hypothetical protein